MLIMVGSLEDKTFINVLKNQKKSYTLITLQNLNIGFQQQIFYVYLVTEKDLVQLLLKQLLVVSRLFAQRYMDLKMLLMRKKLVFS